MLDLPATPITIEIDCAIGICVISQIQLAYRHPNNRGTAQRISEKFARELQSKISQAMPEVAVILEMGWNKEYDLP